MNDAFKDAKQRDVSPFRHDIVGSFLRPDKLKDARSSVLKGEMSLSDLKKIEDETIVDLVEKQKAVGLRAVTDGEFRRSWWHLDFMWGLDGVEKTDIAKGYQFHGVSSRAETARLNGKVGFSDHPFLAHFDFLKDVAGNEVLARQAIPAPSQFLSELQRPENLDATNKHYDGMSSLIEDIATAYQAAIKAFYDQGCRSLQFDDCTWGMMCDATYMNRKLGDGYSLDKMAEMYLKVNNLALENRPKDMALTTHVCRGNFASTWAASGGYDPVAETLFGKENVDAYYLEYDTDRAGGFTPLEFVSPNKLVVLGLISSKIGELEDKPSVISRIKEATQFIPLDRLCLSPQCGFASTEEGNILTEDQQWNKLRFIKEIADEIWQ